MRFGARGSLLVAVVAAAMLTDACCTAAAVRPEQAIPYETPAPGRDEMPPSPTVSNLAELEIVTPSPTAEIAVAPAPAPALDPERIPLSVVPELLAEAGATAAEIGPLTTIAKCETGRPDGLGGWYVRSVVGASNDSVAGPWQIWRGWFQAGEDPLDVPTNARVALRVVRARGGSFGGVGGWTCADLNGIP